jgi:hypothetical protein
MIGTGMNIDEYFENIWKPNTDQYEYSGWKILDKIDMSSTVLDVGCGYNLFKPYLGNRLTGIDPYNDSSDIRISIEDYTSKTPFDVILCLGSINFGSEDIILKQLSKITTLCETGTTIYWRQNPGLKDHKNDECQGIEFFEWSFEKNLRYADMFGFRVEMLAWDNGRRIYSEWKMR